MWMVLQLLKNDKDVEIVMHQMLDDEWPMMIWDIDMGWNDHWHKKLHRKQNM